MAREIDNGLNYGVITSIPGVAFGFKPSIVLADFKPGTRSITLAAGTYRVAVVGGGGDYHATPGSGAGGTSSWAATHSATGGAAKAVGGTGSGGDINTSGGSTAGVGGVTGGAASGHRLGNAPDVATYSAGGGWSTRARFDKAGQGLVDGFGLGIPPGIAQGIDGGVLMAIPGTGAGVSANSIAGLGGGGANLGSDSHQTFGGAGGGGAGAITGTWPGSGGGYSEKVITVASPASFSYTVGAGGGTYGGVGCVIVERL